MNSNMLYVFFPAAIVIGVGYRVGASPMLRKRARRRRYAVSERRRLTDGVVDGVSEGSDHEALKSNRRIVALHARAR